MPWRKLALGAGISVIVLGGMAALIVPAIDEGKDKAAAEERRERAARLRAETARLREEQAPRHGRAPAAASLGALVSALESSITRDARARARAGKLDGPIRSTQCTPAEHVRGVFKCFVVSTSSDRRGEAAFETGYPFVARVDYRERRYAWCKQNPVAGEKAGEAFAQVPLSPECAGELAEIL